MANYRYSIKLSYMHKVSKNKYQQYDFDIKNVKSMIIHSDYISNNMPIIIMDLAVFDQIANIMIDTNNIQNDYIILNVNKIDKEDELGMELPYISGEFSYYTYDQIDKHAKIKYAEDVNYQTSSRIIKIGLIMRDNIIANAISLNDVLTDITMQGAVQYCMSKCGKPVLIEPFNYNPSYKQLIVPTLQSLSKIISYFNGISVFYKTAYRFFIDFDIAYLISSSGNSIGRKGESISSIILNIGDIDDPLSRIEGMSILKKQNMYYIPIMFKDCQLADDYIRSQQYSSLTAISTTGSQTAKLDLRSGDNAVDAIRTVRINNDNVHMLENITSSIANSSTVVSIYKVGVDNSIFTPNKEYSIQYNNTYDKSHNGKYLLNSKQEIFMRDGDVFTGAVMLSLAKIGS